MKYAADFLNSVNAAKEEVRRGVYLVKRDFISDTLETKEAKGLYIQYGCIKIDFQKMEEKIQSKLSKYKENYDLTDGAISQICKEADKQVEDYLEKYGWKLTAEGNMIPLELDAEAINDDDVDEAAEN